jgi:predicted nucleic-acid-binding protein
MIGLDTNVIVRYIAQDDRIQSAQATKLIESLTPDAPGFIALISVVELIWVLQTCYHGSKSELVRVLETLLQTDALIIEHSELVGQALRRFRATGHADFADCLIERCADAAGCEHVYTFDKKAVKVAGMKLLED